MSLIVGDGQFREALKQDNAGTVLAYVQQHGDPNKFIGSNTLLMFACSLHALNSVEVLLANGADVKLSHGTRGPINCTAERIHSSSDEKAEAIFVRLIAAGADVNQVDEQHSPLYRAVWANATRCVKVLLEAGADANFVSPGRSSQSSGESLLQLASRREVDPEIVQLLLDAGASVSFPLV
jgi:ankyrin repeat protein